jgi:hypothetical protein
MSINTTAELRSLGKQPVHTHCLINEPCQPLPVSIPIQRGFSIKRLWGLSAKNGLRCQALTMSGKSAQPGSADKCERGSSLEIEYSLAVTIC